MIDNTKEYRAINISSKNSKELAKTLSNNGIDATMYRINHFSTQKEIVAEMAIYKRIKTVIG